ncbi:methyltransferase domain-containing protein [Streptomyces mirabilis]|uniref:methyltransferase domain-containing protein n=1 Tax=Streptomyces mirabilis TaxID=68239 RepID=UPI003441AB8F
MTATGARAESAYSLGHSPTEMDRLVLQARLYDPITTQALRLAGLSSGMRVLDVGCGAGDVTFAGAGIVGPTGAVTGIGLGLGGFLKRRNVDFLRQER